MYDMVLCLKLKAKFKNSNKMKVYQVKWNLIKLLSNQIIQHKNTLYLFDFKKIKKDSETFLLLLYHISVKTQSQIREKVKKVRQQLCG